MMQAYSIMWFLVCLTILTHYESLFLVPEGFDIWYVMRFVLSIVGLGISLYVYVLSFLKRVRDLEWPMKASLLCLIPVANVVLAFIEGSKESNQYGDVPSKLFPHNKRTRTGLWVDITIFMILHVWVVLGLVLMFEIGAVIKTLVVLIGAGILAWVLIYFRHRLIWLQDDEQIPKVQQHFWFEILMILIIVFFIRSFLVTPYQILGPSMDPSFDGWAPHAGSYADGEFILVDKFSYINFGLWEMWSPNRGDVVVFTPRVNPVKKYLIKRIIGLPGDMIKITEWHVWIKLPWSDEYIQINESSYLSDQNQWNTCLRYPGSGRECTLAEKQTTHEYRVPEWKYFVLWDNRSQSLDSRQCFDSYGGCNSYREAQFIPRSQVQWKVLLSLGHFDILDSVVPINLGDLSWIVSPRWLDIPKSHTYLELQ